MQNLQFFITQLKNKNQQSIQLEDSNVSEQKGEEIEEMHTQETSQSGLIQSIHLDTSSEEYYQKFDELQRKIQDFGLNLLAVQSFLNTIQDQFYINGNIIRFRDTNFESIYQSIIIQLRVSQTLLVQLLNNSDNDLIRYIKLKLNLCLTNTEFQLENYELNTLIQDNELLRQQIKYLQQIQINQQISIERKESNIKIYQDLLQYILCTGIEQTANPMENIQVLANQFKTTNNILCNIYYLGKLITFEKVNNFIDLENISDPDYEQIAMCIGQQTIKNYLKYFGYRPNRLKQYLQILKHLVSQDNLKQLIATGIEIQIQNIIRSSRQQNLISMLQQVYEQVNIQRDLFIPQFECYPNVNQLFDQLIIRYLMHEFNHYSRDNDTGVRAGQNYITTILNIIHSIVNIDQEQQRQMITPLINISIISFFDRANNLVRNSFQDRRLQLQETVLNGKSYYIFTYSGDLLSLYQNLRVNLTGFQDQEQQQHLEQNYRLLNEKIESSLVLPQDQYKQPKIQSVFTGESRKFARVQISMMRYLFDETQLYSDNWLSVLFENNQCPEIFSQILNETEGKIQMETIQLEQMQFKQIQKVFNMKERHAENLIQLICLMCLHSNSIQYINQNIEELNIQTNMIQKIGDLIFYFYLKPLYQMTYCPNPTFNTGNRLINILYKIMSIIKRNVINYQEIKQAFLYRLDINLASLLIDTSNRARDISVDDSLNITNEIKTMYKTFLTTEEQGNLGENADIDISQDLPLTNNILNIMSKNTNTLYKEISNLKLTKSYCQILLQDKYIDQIEREELIIRVLNQRRYIKPKEGEIQIRQFLQDLKKRVEQIAKQYN